MNAAGKVIDLPKIQPGAQAPDVARPVIRWIGGQLARVVAEAEAALLPVAGLYQRGGLLVRVARLERPEVQNGVRREAGALTIVPVDAPYLVLALATCAQFQKYDQRAKDWIQINPPPAIASALLSNVGAWKFPALTAVVEAPTLRPDGSVLDVPGYDADTGIVFDPGMTKFPAIPASPNRDDALDALRVLNRLIAGFPFAPDESAGDYTDPGSAHRSVALAAILTACVRRALRTAPLFGFTAPSMGSGKSLLADVVAMIQTGRPAAVISQGEDGADERKRLLAVLIEGDAVVVVDNIERPLASDSLCSILTQTTYKDRVLGVSRTVTVPTCVTWLATGNNLELAGDLSTRALLCRIEPELEHPEQRVFDLNLYEYVPAHRGKLAAATVTVLRAYIVAGKPKQPIATFGRFEQWSDLVRAALVWLDERDPVLTQAEVQEADPVRAALGAVLLAWNAAFGAERVTVARAVQRSDSDSDLKDALMGVAGEKDASINSRRLGRYLRKNLRRIQDGLRFEAGVPDGVSKRPTYGVSGVSGVSANPSREVVARNDIFGAIGGANTENTENTGRQS